jgi:hypothetical protein
VNARILLSEEWPLLDGTEADAKDLWRTLNPETSRILVVEDGGKIVGCWAFLRVVHAECLWVAPSHRGVFAVARRLLRGMREIAGMWGTDRVVTGSVSPSVTDLIEKVGGVPVPAESFVIPVRGKIGARLTRKEPEREMGRLFHLQLEALVKEDQHPEDEEHDKRVGRALLRAIGEGQPEQAAEEYNAWARVAGYEPVRFLGRVNGRMRADIVTAVIEVDDEYHVSVVQEELCR